MMNKRKNTNSNLSRMKQRTEVTKPQQSPAMQTKFKNVQSKYLQQSQSAKSIDKVKT